MYAVQATHEVKFPLQQPLVFSSHVRGTGDVNCIHVRQLLSGIITSQ